MPNRIKTKVLSLAIALASMHTSVSANEVKSIGQVRAHLLAPINVAELPRQDNDALLEKNNLKQQKTDEHARTPFQFAEQLETNLKPYDEWQTVKLKSSGSDVDEEFAVWQIKVSSPDAHNLNLGFKSFFLPEGATLYIYTPDGDYQQTLTHDDNDDHGQYWTPIIPGDEVILEVNVPDSIKSQVELQLEQVGHGYVKGSDVDSVMASGFQLKSGSCNVDAVCSEGDDWRDEINSVAHYQFSNESGSFVCTGAAINNTANDGRRLFLTANHCLDAPQYAPSVVAYWKYENTTCRTPGSSESGSRGNGRRDLINSGSVMLAQYDPTDMYLLEFDDPFPEAANVFLAGWNRDSQLPVGAVGIHHPRGEEKRISFDNDPLTTTGTHLRVADWDLGTTEGGSSGSPLFDLDHYIIGQLTGGQAACGNDEYDIYGHMAVNWEGGGAQASRVRDFLDPTNSGVMKHKGMPASGPTPTPIVTPTPTPPIPTMPPRPPLPEPATDRPVTTTPNCVEGSINFNNAVLGPFADQDIRGKQYIEDDGCTLILAGNTWKIANKITHQMQPNTVLEFEYYSEQPGEIQGILFDTENPETGNGGRTFNLSGTDDWGLRHFTYTQYGSYQTIRIPVGAYFAGYRMYIGFANDDDANHNAITHFRNVRLIEE